MPPDERLNRGSGVSKSLRPKKRPKIVPVSKSKKKSASPLMGNNPIAKLGGGASPKGSGDPAQIDPTTKAGQKLVQKYNTDGRYGYYNTTPNHEKYAVGQWVPGMRDAFDGGGSDTNDTFFKGAPVISNLLNIAKVRPYGQSETPREQIGFRDVADMTDRGGAQHSGGQYEGGGMISLAGNLVDKLSGVDTGTKTRYYERPQPVGLMDASPAQEPRQRNYVGSGMNPSNAYGMTPSYVSDVFQQPPMPNIAGILDNTQFQSPEQSMEDMRINMAKEMLADKYGTAFFTFPEAVRNQEIADVLRKMPTTGF